MGYAHHYRIYDWDSPDRKAAWAQLIKDIPRIIDASGVEISGPTEDRDVVTPPLLTENKIYVNGARDLSYEPLILDKREDKRHPGDFCKTARRPYDIVVTCILLRAYMLAPNIFRVRSDGSWEEWQPARDLYHRLWPDAPIECPWADEEEE